jgi:hypothetical protein
MSVRTPTVEFKGDTVYMPGHGAASMIWVGAVPEKYREKVCEAMQKAYIMGAAEQTKIIKDVLDVPTHLSDLD